VKGERGIGKGIEGEINTEVDDLHMGINLKEVLDAKLRCTIY
jgi:hypothetical protein